MGWSRHRCFPVQSTVVDPNRKRHPGSESDQRNPTHRLSAGRGPSIIFRSRVPMTGCATIFLGRVNITFLWLASGALFGRMIHLRPILLARECGNSYATSEPSLRPFLARFCKTCGKYVNGAGFVYRHNSG